MFEVFAFFLLVQKNFYSNFQIFSKFSNSFSKFFYKIKFILLDGHIDFWGKIGLFGADAARVDRLGIDLQGAPEHPRRNGGLRSGRERPASAGAVSGAVAAAFPILLP